MKIGDKVRFLSEVGGGVVAGFQGKNIVLVEDEDGFQIGSAKAALHKTGQIVLQGHMHHCVLDGIESGHKDETMDRLFSAIEQFSRMV